MRRSLTLVLLACLVLLLAAPAFATPQQERRVALVIGNGAYKTAPLKNPANDAHDMAAALKSVGFEVILRENASLRQMNEAIDQFWGSLKKGGVGLFFFAGHGMQVGGENYLVPVDARVALEKDVQYECVNAGKVLGRMEDAGNGLNIVILDACRNNPFARSFRSESRGLAKMDAPSGSLVAFATAPGDVAADGAGKNGLYTSHLLRVLRTPGLKIEDVLKQVRIGVAADSAKLGKRQTPWESSSLMGDFYFKPGAGGGQVASLPVFQPPAYPAPSDPKPLRLSTPQALAEPQRPQRAWLGVRLADVDPSPVGVKPGTAVLVEKVYSGSPAEAAGLLPGDLLFTPGGDAMNARGLWERLSHAGPSDVLRLSHWHNGQVRPVAITLAPPSTTPAGLASPVPETQPAAPQVDLAGSLVGEYRLAGYASSVDLSVRFRRDGAGLGATAKGNNGPFSFETAVRDVQLKDGQLKFVVVQKGGLFPDIWYRFTCAVPPGAEDLPVVKTEKRFSATGAYAVSLEFPNPHLVREGAPEAPQPSAAQPSATPSAPVATPAAAPQPVAQGDLASRFAGRYAVASGPGKKPGPLVLDFVVKDGQLAGTPSGGASSARPVSITDIRLEGKTLRFRYNYELTVFGIASARYTDFAGELGGDLSALPFSFDTHDGAVREGWLLRLPQGK